MITSFCDVTPGKSLPTLHRNTLLPFSVEKSKIETGFSGRVYRHLFLMYCDVIMHNLSIRLLSKLVHKL